MASLDMSTAPGSSSQRSLTTAENGNCDTAAPSPSLGASQLSYAHDIEIEEEEGFEEAAGNQAKEKESQEVNKGKGRHPTKHGVMSLPAEIRETCAFLLSAWHLTRDLLT